MEVAVPGGRGKGEGTSDVAMGTSSKSNTVARRGGTLERAGEEWGGAGQCGVVRPRVGRVKARRDRLYCFTA